MKMQRHCETIVLSGRRKTDRDKVGNSERKKAWKRERQRTKNCISRTKIASNMLDILYGEGSLMKSRIDERKELKPKNVVENFQIKLIVNA